MNNKTGLIDFSKIQSDSASYEKLKSDKDRYNNRLTEYVQSLRKRAGDKMLEEFSQLRGFSMDTIKKAEIFYISDMSEMLIPKYIDELESFGVISETNKKPIFDGRWVIPIKNSERLVENLVGYSNMANERYIYGTAKYYRRRNTLYGLENLTIAYEMGYAFLTEGITDTIRLRDLGHLNSFARCGTHSNNVAIQQLNRCRHGVISIPDRDTPGIKSVKNWNFNRSATIFINFQYKDLDELCKQGQDNIEWLEEYIKICENWILSDTHKGHKMTCEKITME